MKITTDFSTETLKLRRVWREGNGSFKEKMNKEIPELIELTEIYRIFHPATAQYTFFSAAHGASPK
jgi:hypothetical protein